MAVSTVSSEPSARGDRRRGEGPSALVLDWPTDRELAPCLLIRAEQAGYPSPAGHAGHVPARREAARSAAGLPLPGGHRDRQLRFGPRLPSSSGPAAQRRIRRRRWESSWSEFSNPCLTWEDLEFLRAHTTPPIALKGILHPDGARAAREHAIDAVLVSNHGGRQIDGAIASLDALPAIVEAVGGELGVLLDSGSVPAPISSRRWRSELTRAAGAPVPCGDWRSAARRA